MILCALSMCLTLSRITSLTRNPQADGRLPRLAIRRGCPNADAERLLALAGERHAVGFVLGLPINMDGTEGPRAQSTRAFARNFARLTELPIALWDERLSTAAVERALIEADASRARRKAVIDQHAAAYILQGALDRLVREQSARIASRDEDG
jgi:putative Holliday junction resolvase